MRIAIYILAAFSLAWLAGQDAALAYWRADQASAVPATVPAFWANDPELRLRASDRLKTRPDLLAAQAPAIAAAAKDVLRRNPLDVMAMRQLGVLADLDRAGSGRGYIALAERISRRDLTTELLSIEDAATYGDADAAATLRHYHHALSVYPLAKAEVMPFISSLLGEPEIRQALIAYADQPWLRDFAVNAVEYDVSPAALSDFYADMAGKMPQAELQKGAMRLVRWLVSNNEYVALQSYAGRIPGLAGNAFSPIGLTVTTSDARYMPLSWALINEATISAQADGGVLLVRVEPGTTAAAATRLTMFAPGEYEFVQTLAAEADAPLARTEWQVTCPGDPRNHLVQEPAPQTSGPGQQRARLSIPAGCAAQFWRLQAAAESSQLASAVRISGLSLNTL